jgi:hypothetical protein
MVCFRYIILNTLQKEDNKDDNDNNNNNKTTEAAATTAVNHPPYRCKKIKLMRTAHITYKVLG